MTSPSLPEQKEKVLTIRRFLVLLTTVAIVVAILVAAAPVEAGERRVALGVWMPTANRDMSVYDRFAATVGRQPAIVTMSVQWGDPDRKKFPTTLAKQAWNRGSAVMITWSPTINPIEKETGKYARFARINKGKHDKYIKNFARAAKKYGKPVFLRFAHEVNASFFPWTMDWRQKADSKRRFWNNSDGAYTNKNDNNPKKYKKAWVRIYNLFQTVGATNVKFLWTVAKESCSGCNPYKKFYPPKGVHYVGFSTFNWGGFNGRPFASFAQGMKQPMKNFKQFTKKPVFVAELGTTHLEGPGGETKADWIAAGYPEVRRLYPKVKAIIYQHVDNTGAAHGHPNWSLDDPDGSIDAYENLLTKTKFKGKVNKKGKIY